MPATETPKKRSADSMYVTPERMAGLSPECRRFAQLSADERRAMGEDEVSEMEARLARELAEQEEQERRRQEKEEQERRRKEKEKRRYTIERKNGIALLSNFAERNVVPNTDEVWDWSRPGLPDGYLVRPFTGAQKACKRESVKDTMDAFFEECKDETPNDDFTGRTHVNVLLTSLERWAIADSKSITVNNKANSKLFDLYQQKSVWWDKVTEAQISDLKIRFYATVAFIDCKDGKLAAVVDSAVGGVHIGYSIQSANKNLAMLANQALMCAPGVPIERYKKSLARTLRDKNKADKIWIARMDMRYFYRMMNPEVCGRPVGFSKNDKKDAAVNGYETLVNYALHRSLKSLQDKAKDYGVWSWEYVYPYTVPGGPKLTEEDKKMTAGIYFPQACLFKRLLKNCDLGSEKNWFVTEEQKKMLRDPKIPMDKCGLVKALWQD